MVAELAALGGADDDRAGATAARGGAGGGGDDALRGDGAPDAAGEGAHAGGGDLRHSREVDARAAYDELCHDFPRLPARQLRALRLVLAESLPRGAGGVDGAGGALPEWMRLVPEFLSGVMHVSESAARDGVQPPPASSSAAAVAEAPPSSVGGADSLLRVRPGIDDAGAAVASEAAALTATATLRAVRCALSGTRDGAVTLLRDLREDASSPVAGDAAPLADVTSAVEAAARAVAGGVDAAADAVPTAADADAEVAAALEDPDDFDYAADDGRVDGVARAVAGGGTPLDDGGAGHAEMDDGGVARRVAQILSCVNYRVLHAMSVDTWDDGHVTEDVVWCALALFRHWHGCGAGDIGATVCSDWAAVALGVDDAASAPIAARWVDLLHVLRDRMSNEPDSVPAILASVLAFYSSRAGRAAGAARAHGTSATGGLSSLNGEVRTHVGELAAMARAASDGAKAATALETTNRVVLGVLSELCSAAAVHANKRARITLHIATMKLASDLVAALRAAAAALRDVVDSRDDDDRVGVVCSDALGACRVLRFCVLGGMTVKASATDVAASGALDELLGLLATMWRLRALEGASADSLLSRVLPELHAEVSESALHIAANAEGGLQVVCEAEAVLGAIEAADGAGPLDAHAVAWRLVAAKARDGAAAAAVSPSTPAPLSSMFAPPAPAAAAPAPEPRAVDPKVADVTAAAGNMVVAQAQAVCDGLEAVAERAPAVASRRAADLATSLRLVAVLRPLLVGWQPAGALSAALRRVDRCVQAAVTRATELLARASGGAEGDAERKDDGEADASETAAARDASDFDRVLAHLREARLFVKQLAGLDGAGSGKGD
uniref:Uncharacterized protein n=1 Tax=Bicosoecida sp. CB-2014 TaxID=1486930 RepID=A0A7S1GBS7_9STRA